MPPRDPADLEDYRLGRLIERGDLAFECRWCRHVAKLDPGPLIARYGSEVRVGALRDRARCRKCGGQQPFILLHRRGVRGDRAWLPSPPYEGR